MTDTIALTGIVATTPLPIGSSNELKITSFRLASAQRRFDKSRDRWIEGETNWYTVTAFRQLASNVLSSVVKGDRVVITGRLRIRAWQSGDKSGTNVDLEADSVGHDLAWGTTSFTRVISSPSASASVDVHEPEPADDVFPSGAGLSGAGLSGAGLSFAEPSFAESSSDDASTDEQPQRPVFESADVTAPF